MRWLSFALFISFVCCGSDNPTNDTSSILGTYQLTSATVSGDGQIVTLTPPEMVGTIAFSDQGRYAISVSSNLDGVPPITGSGTFSYIGGIIVFENALHSGYSASLSGPRITLILANAGLLITMRFDRT